jgi:hypothetical protein
VQIDRDGTRVLQTGYGVDDNLGNSAIWKSLEAKSFESFGQIEPEASDAQKAVLKGKIRIVIFHVNNQMAQAQIDELRLIRGSDSGDRWQLAPGEVARTAKAAGL